LSFSQYCMDVRGRSALLTTGLSLIVQVLQDVLRYVVIRAVRYPCKKFSDRQGVLHLAAWNSAGRLSMPVSGRVDPPAEVPAIQTALPRQRLPFTTLGKSHRWHVESAALADKRSQPGANPTFDRTDKIETVGKQQIDCFPKELRHRSAAPVSLAAAGRDQASSRDGAQLGLRQSACGHGSLLEASSSQA
jgi:hypothetical protein